MDKALETLVNAIAVAGQALGMEAARLWPQIVMVTWIRSVTMLVVNLTACTAFALLFRPVWNWAKAGMAKEAASGTDGDFLYVLAAALFYAVSLFVVGGSVGSLPDILAGVFAPEAKTVLDMASKVAK